MARTHVTAILATLVLALAAAPAHATLNSRFGTDAQGMVTVPAIDKLASSIVGRPIATHCYPDDPGSAESGHTLAELAADGTASVADVIYLDGSTCAQVWNLLTWRHHRSWMRDRWTTPQDAGDALLHLVHEAMHVRLQSVDESAVECTAYRNTWPVLVSLKLPVKFRAHVWEDGVRVGHGNTDDSYRAVC